jgi:hypothetical protein
MADAAKKTGGADSKNPPRYNPVQTMMIFEEKVHKEENFQRGYKKREYTINPFTMAVIADKPNYVTPKEPFMTKPAGSNMNAHEIPAGDDVVDRAFKLEAMRRKIQTASMQPR